MLCDNGGMAPSSGTPDTAGPILLLVNLGTPDAPTPAAVRRYLAEFLGDPRVVSIPPLLWKPLLHGLILPLRAPRAARKYAQVWMDEGSPLAVHTRRLADAVQARLPHWDVRWAMRYGSPSQAALMDELGAAGGRRLVVLPLYPQYSTTTTASVADVLAARANGLDVTFIEQYATDAGWVHAVAGRIARFRRSEGAGEHLLFSFHGLPQRLADGGDPYPHQCEASAAAIAAALGLREGEWSLAYQSRFGKERWLQPYTVDTLDALTERGIRTIDVACPGFAADCLETLEEIAIGLRARVSTHGGTLRYIPCLNDDADHAAALAALAERSLGT